MAAAARPPGIGDARVPCPLCGGLIHPVAGRCKHCKEDLTALRAGRPQAAAVLPPLNSKPAAPVAGHGTSVHVAAAPYAPQVAAPVAAVGREPSAPILPQRVTGRHMTAQRAPGRLLRNWPVLVIILAVIAIVTAVVIMVMPTDRKGGGTRQLMPTPAPERMETMPDQSSQADPWAQPNHGNNVPPGTLPGPQPRVTPDPPMAPDPDDLVDPDDPNSLYGGLGGASSGAMFLAMASQACKKLRTCSNLDQSLLRITCDQLAAVPLPPLPQSCDAAQRCLNAIDHIDCDTTSSSANPMNMVMVLQDCAKAASEC